MTLAEDLDAATPAQRPGIKARAIAALANLDGTQFTRGQFTATVVNPHVEGQLFVCSLIVMRAGKDVTPPDLNPIAFNYADAPYFALFEDAAGDVSRTFTQRDGTQVTKTFSMDLRRLLLRDLADLLR